MLESRLVDLVLFKFFFIKPNEKILHFCILAQNLRDAVHENNCLQMEIRSVTKKLQSSEEAEKIALEGKTQQITGKRYGRSTNSTLKRLTSAGVSPTTE